MKKFLALLLAASMLLCLCACGNAPAEEVKEEAPAEEVKEEAPAEEVKEEASAEGVTEIAAPEDEINEKNIEKSLKDSDGNSAEISGEDNEPSFNIPEGYKLEQPEVDTSVKNASIYTLEGLFESNMTVFCDELGIDFKMSVYRDLCSDDTTWYELYFDNKYSGIRLVTGVEGDYQHLMWMPDEIGNVDDFLIVCAIMAFTVDPEAEDLDYYVDFCYDSFEKADSDSKGHFNTELNSMRYYIDVLDSQLSMAIWLS